MKISKNWISEFLHIPKGINLEDELTQLGLEVDTITKNKDDYIIDIEFTPNRGDCLSVLGTTRDLAAYKNKKIKLPSISPYTLERKNNIFRNLFSDICPEYRFMILNNISLETETPKFIKDRLLKADITLVNIIVDISNYVMIEIGQPTHAFDADKITGKLSVINSKKELTFFGINNKEYKVNKGTPVIVDDNNVIHALPGVMGSKLSSVGLNTKNVLLESAFFLPDIVRALSSKYRIQTDSSYRFERGVDSKIQELALSRIHFILSKSIALEKCKLHKITKKSPQTKTKSFRFDSSLFKRILGIHIPQSKIKSILCNLGFTFKSEKIVVPSYRHDVSSNYDLVEEISRMIGYNNIPESPLSTFVYSKNKNYDYENRLVTLGYNEVINFTFISKNYSKNEKQLILENPISKDKSVMRESLIPGLLQNVSYNQNRQQKSIKLFESGKVYKINKNKVFEFNIISGVISGLKSASDLVKNQYMTGIDDLKSDILSMLPGCSFDTNEDSIYFSSENSLKIIFDNKVVGECGLVSNNCTTDFLIKGSTFAFEINEELITNINKVNYDIISQFPAVYKDITLITNIENNLSKIINDISKNSYKYLKNIRIKDIFINSDKLQLNNRNVTLEICLQSNEKTLNDHEINQTIQRISSDIKARYKLKIQEV